MPPFGPEDADERRGRLTGRGRRALPAGKHLLQREPDLLRVGRKRDRILGAGLEDPAQIAVGQVVGEYNDRPLGVLADGLVDEEERAVRGARRRDDEQLGVGRVKRGPDAVEVVDDAHQLDAALSREQVLDVHTVEVLVDREQSLDRHGGHGVTAARTSAGRALPAQMTTGAWAGTPTLARSVNHSLPLSVA